MFKYELTASRLSKVIVRQTHVHTDIQTDRHMFSKLYTTPRRGWSKSPSLNCIHGPLDISSAMLNSVLSDYFIYLFELRIVTQ